MIQIDDKILSLDLFEKEFICDIPKCLGECCVEGESGAPLEDDEVELLDSIMPHVLPFLSDECRQEIERQGTYVVDADGDKVTPILRGRECVYTYFDDAGVCKCAIERAYNEGLVDFKKPISCHLYPIRVTKYRDYEALNYHQWHVCQVARLLGQKEGVPVYRFLKEPLVRKYGEAFYEELEQVADFLANREE